MKLGHSIRLRTDNRNFGTRLVGIYEQPTNNFWVLRPVESYRPHGIFAVSKLGSYIRFIFAYVEWKNIGKAL